MAKEASQAGNLSSMTGFARREGGDERVTWVWEAKSVNGKGLDIRSRLAYGFEALEPNLRRLAQKVFARGNFQVSLNVQRSAGGSRLAVNQEALDQIVSLAKTLQVDMGAPPPRVEGLLALKGVLETVEEDEAPKDRERRLVTMEDDLVRCFEALNGMRQQEGARLAELLSDILNEIEALTAQAKAQAESQVAVLQKRLVENLEEIMQAQATLSEERLHQEVALLAVKADLREELDRLDAHVIAAREHLAQGGAVGRKLDFLCQEFNREANTLCSKSNEVALTKIGLALKSAIDQMREQVQNIE